MILRLSPSPRSLRARVLALLCAIALIAGLGVDAHALLAVGGAQTAVAGVAAHAGEEHTHEHPHAPAPPASDEQAAHGGGHGGHHGGGDAPGDSSAAGCCHAVCPGTVVPAAACVIAARIDEPPTVAETQGYPGLRPAPPIRPPR